MARAIGINHVAREVRDIDEAVAGAGVDVAPSGGPRFHDPWGNSIEIVDYRDVQFTKAPAVLRVLVPEGLEKSDAARAELDRKGLGG